MAGQQAAGPAKSRQNWIQWLVLPLGLGLMETCWVYCWSLLLGYGLTGGVGRPLLAPLVIFLLFIAAQAATRWVLARGWSLRRSRAALLALGVLASLFVVRLSAYGQLEWSDLGWLPDLALQVTQALNDLWPPLTSLGLALFLWWRGMRFGREALRFEEIEGAFGVGAVGIVSCLLLLVLVSPSTNRATQAGIGLCVVGYLFAGLTSLSLARLESVREQGRVRSGLALALNRQWLAAVLSVVTGLVLLALLLAQLLSFDIMAAVFAPLGEMLARLLYAILYVVSYPVALLLDGIVLFLRQFVRTGEQQTPPQAPDALTEWQRQVPEGGLPPEVALIAKLVIGALLTLGVALALMRAVRPRRAMQADDGVAEERDAVANWRQMISLLLAWLRLRLRRPSPLTKPAVGMAAGAPAIESEQPAPMASVRELYRRLLRLGASLGSTRSRQETPYEHLPRLQEHLEPGEDVAALTEAYVKARYGPEAPAESEVIAARSHWERVGPKSQTSAGAGRPPEATT